MVNRHVLPQRPGNCTFDHVGVTEIWSIWPTSVGIRIRFLVRRSIRSSIFVQLGEEVKLLEWSLNGSWTRFTDGRENTASLINLATAGERSNKGPSQSQENDLIWSRLTRLPYIRARSGPRSPSDPSDRGHSSLVLSRWNAYTVTQSLSLLFAKQKCLTHTQDCENKDTSHAQLPFYQRQQENPSAR